ncbi:MAG: hypothetical protein V2A73_19795, partial [Pseudomonadota bacterium]
VRPDWALELSTEEQDLGFETAAILEEMRRASHRSGPLVAELVEQTVECALDPTFVSNFVRQLGANYVAEPNR